MSEIRKIELSEATESLAEYTKLAKETPLILLSAGKPVAALVPIEDTDLETLLLSTDPAFQALLERSRARQKLEGGLSLQEARQRLGLA